jgi:hypothetical protein
MAKFSSPNFGCRNFDGTHERAGRPCWTALLVAACWFVLDDLRARL